MSALSADERASLRPGIDIAALEELLHRVPASARVAVLNAFRVDPPPGVFSVVGAIDPEIDALLRRIERARD